MASLALGWALRLPCRSCERWEGGARTHSKDSLTPLLQMKSTMGWTWSFITNKAEFLLYPLPSLSTINSPLFSHHQPPHWYGCLFLKSHVNKNLEAACFIVVIFEWELFKEGRLASCCHYTLSAQVLSKGSRLTGSVREEQASRLEACVEAQRSGLSMGFWRARDPEMIFILMDQGASG